MTKRQIPNSDLLVSSLCLGTGHIGSVIDEETSFAMMDRYLALDGNFIDTAAVYANWLPVEPSISEKTIGKWMKARGNRAQLIIATKGAHPDLATMHIPRLSPAEIVSDLDASLKHLQTDVIDLYWLHRDDTDRPVGEILETLNEQVQAGKIRFFGCSNWTLPRIQFVQDYVKQHDLQGFVANQMMWSLAVIRPKAFVDQTMVVMDETMWEYHHSSGLAAIPYSSQAQGLFHKMAQGVPPGAVGGDARYDAPENVGRFKRIQRLAADLALDPSQIILGYLLSQPFPTIPIIGCQNLDQLEDSMMAADVRLAPEQLSYLESGR